jgi:hypothetical protein
MTIEWSICGFDKASEQLDKASEQLDKASEQLKVEYVLQVIPFVKLRLFLGLHDEDPLYDCYPIDDALEGQGDCTKSHAPQRT